MTMNDIERKQLVLINYLQQKINEYDPDNNWKVKAEYSTNDESKRVIVVQEQDGEKEVFYGDCIPLNNYYMLDIYGLTIRESKNASLMFGYLIGESIVIETQFTNNKNEIYNEKWQLIFSQWVNPQAIEYLDIRRVGYNATLKCIVNKVWQEKIN